ncbi:hypothetical protein [Pseudomonas turukhanskensis]|uniref:Uncharacterized protein n=1 Tax=Pseudomonas turukhanskensis TaxID=1806536 RepID=A0A9W6NEL5_9PSED|nr:hypothetical protein [Pseudomonas turukhanskensis]GLK87835.1 hypothetical protein GCM10017655_08970 [Pseudomonas turukhanskensis]
MSLQALFSLALSHPAQSINALALFFAVAGSWLLIATRIRQRRAIAGLVVESEGAEAELSTLDTSTQQLNRFFTRFGYACLAIGLMVSWFSTQF